MGSLSAPPPPPSQQLQQQPPLNYNNIFTSSSCWASGDELSTLISSWRPYLDLSNGISAESPPCDVHPGQVQLFWCGACVRPLCGVCVKDHPTTSSSSSVGLVNGTASSTSSPSHTLHPLASASAMDSLNTAVEAESLAVGNLLSEVYNYERKQQDLTLKLIDALSLAKAELERCLIQGGGLKSSQELSEIHSLLTTHRRSPSPPQQQPPPPTTQNSSQKRTSLLNLHRNLITRRSELQTLLNSSHPLYSIAKNFNLAEIDNLRLIHSFTTAKLASSKLHSSAAASSATALKISQNPSVVLGPRFFFDMEMVGLQSLGRIIIETRPDVAPRMAENFHALVRGERGFGFEGCVVFQCWRGESVITGDFEHQNGRGGHSIYNNALFMPEDTRLPATRGALGMRRTQKRHDSKGLVGSQFRIILQDMPGFTGIFGHVLEGIEVVERISECGDASGNPMKRCAVRRCGEL